MKNPEFVQTAPADLRGWWHKAYSEEALQHRHAPRSVPASERAAGALIQRLLTDQQMRRPWEAMRRAAIGREGWAIRIADAAIGAERHANAMEENRLAGKARPYKGRAPRAKHLRELATDLRAVAEKIGLEGLGGRMTVPERFVLRPRVDLDRPRPTDEKMDSIRYMKKNPSGPERWRHFSLQEWILEAAEQAEQLGKRTPSNAALAPKPTVKHIRVIEFLRALAPFFRAEFGDVLPAPLAALASVALQARVTPKQIEKYLPAGR